MGYSPKIAICLNFGAPLFQIFLFNLIVSESKIWFCFEPSLYFCRLSLIWPAPAQKYCPNDLVKKLNIADNQVEQQD